MALIDGEVETESRPLEFARDRLIRDADEDPWEILPGKGARKRLQRSTAVRRQNHNRKQVTDASRFGTKVWNRGLFPRDLTS